MFHCLVASDAALELVAERLELSDLGEAMKKALTIHEEMRPRNVTRADLVVSEGSGLEVDGRMKMMFPSLAAAQKRGRDLKAEFPMLQVKIYAAAEKTRSLIGPEPEPIP